MTTILDTEKKSPNITVEKLRDIISGKPGLVTKGAAITSLGKKAGPENSKVFQKVFMDEKQKPAIRARALEQYLKSGEKKPEAFLIKNLANPNPEVVGAVVKEMGKYGGAAGLQALYDLKLKDSAVIGYRDLSMLLIGSAGVKAAVQPLKKIKIPEVTLPKLSLGSPELRAAGLKSALPDAKMVAKSIEVAGFKGKMFYSHEIICGKERLALCLSDPAAKTEGMENISLEGMLFVKDDCPEGYSLQAYIFFIPVKGSSGKIIGMNTRGKVLYSGIGQLKDGAISFELQSVRNSLYPNTALSISGIRKGKELSVSKAESGIVEKQIRVLPSRPSAVDLSPAAPGK